MTTTVRTLLALLAAALLGATVAAGWIWAGFYDISATTQHLQPTFTLLEWVGRRSIGHHASGTPVPPGFDDPARVARGGACFRDKCLACHGAPGVAQGEIGRSMQPLPGPLVDASRRFNAPELHWVLRKGIKMSGMPAWEYRMSDTDIWATVAFLQRLPSLDPGAFQAATAGPTCSSEPDPAPPGSAPDPQRGKVALTQYACNACHLVPGVTGSAVHVGPPLAGFASRGLIAGRLTNDPGNLVAWIRHPQQVDPGTAMPDLEVTDRDARDIAAYLATLH